MWRISTTSRLGWPYPIHTSLTTQKNMNRVPKLGFIFCKRRQNTEVIITVQYVRDRFLLGFIYMFTIKYERSYEEEYDKNRPG